MTMPTSFLGGAQDRLLPASIPFRFFLSASVFHILAWAVLFLAADDLAGYQGGPGPMLAAIHLATLGVLAMTAIGASYQLLPIVTRRPLVRDWPARLSFWLIVPGICAMTWGMGTFSQGAMQIGADLTSFALVVFALLTADNLRRSGGIPVVSAHGWLALIGLFGLILLGLLLISDFETGSLSNHQDLALLHMVVASFGFMGALVLGLSLVLIPMFVLSRSLPTRPSWTQVGLTTLALLSFAVGVLLSKPSLQWLALAFGVGAAGCYLWLMRSALQSSMRKRLGLPFVLMRVSWGALVATLFLAGLALAGVDIVNLPALTGFLLVAGWLLTFLTGVLQRIMPFLASMHAAGKSGLPPLLSDLTAETPLKIHTFCHLAALVACIAGILLDLTLLIQIGAALGCAGAVSFAVFACYVLLKLRQSAPTN